jgi:hypothetical protein
MTVPVYARSWSDDGVTEWHCPPPPEGVPYIVVRAEWHGDTRRILEIRVPEDGAR